MSGHSKWSTIKRKKEKEDARRGQAFTKVARLITVAAREGGPDPESNFKLRLAIDKAKGVNMPSDNIDRAVKRGSGGMDGSDYEQFYYEGYGPGGVAIMLDIMTDNRNRTAADARHMFSKHGGNLGEAGCVAWMFDQKGVLVIDKTDDTDHEALLLQAIEAGAEDVEVGEDTLLVITEPADFQEVKSQLEAEGVQFAEAAVVMRPQNTLAVEGGDASKLINLLDALEAHDDIQEVYTNADFAEEEAEA